MTWNTTSKGITDAVVEKVALQAMEMESLTVNGYDQLLQLVHEQEKLHSEMKDSITALQAAVGVMEVTLDGLKYYIRRLVSWAEDEDDEEMEEQREEVVD